MIAVLCRDRHRTRDLCPACSALQRYADQRIERCPYGAEKPTCFNCPIHCYKPAMREAVRTVMRYAGPKMLGRHPILAVRHILDGRHAVSRPPGRRAGPDPFSW